MSADARKRPRRVEREYARIVERHRDELHAHSRRILRSSQDAEDALQEALLRAWRALPSFEGRSSLRSWLYRIVTNASLDTAKQRARRVMPIDLDPDRPGDHSHASAIEPATEHRYLTREDFERALVVAIRLLTARQRAVLILREALGFPARETASHLEISVAATNSSLQRARARLEGHLDEQPAEETPSTLEDPRLRELVERHAEAWEREDVDALIAILTEEAKNS